MSRYLHLRPDSGDLAVRSDDETGTLDTHIGLSIHRFFDPDAKLFADVGGVIGTKLDGQAVLCAKLRLLRGGVLGDADKATASLVQLPVSARGKKKTTTFLPVFSAIEKLPVSVGMVKAGTIIPVSSILIRS